MAFAWNHVNLHIWHWHGKNVNFHVWHLVYKDANVICVQACKLTYLHLQEICKFSCMDWFYKDAIFLVRHLYISMAFTWRNANILVKAFVWKHIHCMTFVLHNAMWHGLAIQNTDSYVLCIAQPVGKYRTPRYYQGQL